LAKRVSSVYAIGAGGIAIEPDETQLRKLPGQFLGDSLSATAEEFQVGNYIRGNCEGAIAQSYSNDTAAARRSTSVCDTPRHHSWDTQSHNHSCGRNKRTVSPPVDK